MHTCVSPKPVLLKETLQSLVQTCHCTGEQTEATPLLSLAIPPNLTLTPRTSHFCPAAGSAASSLQWTRNQLLTVLWRLQRRLGCPGPIQESCKYKFLSEPGHTGHPTPKPLTWALGAAGRRNVSVESLQHKAALEKCAMI